MEVSFFLARVLGSYLVVMALAIMVNKERYRMAYKELKRDTMEIHLKGLVSFVLGLLVVSIHNIWISWPILITLIGWGMLIKGAVTLIAPNLLLKFSKDMGVSETLLMYGFAGLIIGAFLLYVGFVV